MIAQSKKHYRQAWESHVAQLATLALAADVTHDRWQATLVELRDWIDRATAAQDLPDEPKQPGSAS